MEEGVLWAWEGGVGVRVWAMGCLYGYRHEWSCSKGRLYDKEDPIQARFLSGVKSATGN